MVTSRLYTLEGIILKRKNIGEADRLLTLFTRQSGKVTLLAKGIRKINSRRSGHLEMLSHVVVSVHKGKWKDIVTEAKKTPDTFTNLSLEQLAYCYFACELVDRLLPESQEHTDVFYLLSQTLTSIGTTNDRHTWRMTTHQFSLRLLRSLGFLSPTKELSLPATVGYVEQLSEKRLKTAALLTKLTQLG